MTESTWRLGVRMEVLPGDGVRERFEYAARYGFDAVELPGRFLADYRDDLMTCRHDLPLPVSSISLGFGGSLASADPEARQHRGIVVPPAGRAAPFAIGARPAVRVAVDASCV